MQNTQFQHFTQVLASYACEPSLTRGRAHKEAESPHRTPFQRDRDRIIHSAAFRRLEYKTQVFVNHEGDHYRTRLTHTLEVSQLSRSIARALGLNEDLAEAIALAHDLGHPPFGHAGEEGLNEAAKDFGGFDHNAHALRILTALEHRYAEFDGLNLSWETLEGIAKHNGPLTGKAAVRVLSSGMKAQIEAIGIEPETFPSAEAQIAALADDIAYNNHDMDDGIRADLFDLDALETLPMVGDAVREVKKRYPGLEAQRLTHEAIRRVIHAMVEDLLAQTAKNLADSGVKNVEDIRRQERPLAAFSCDMEAANLKLKSFLMENMYRHYKVNRMSSKARRVVQELFVFLTHEPECLPTHWRRLAGKSGSAESGVAVINFIAGMTDRFALEEHARLYDLYAKS